MKSSNPIPLIVDCDGTLVKTDLLVENFFWVLSHKPYLLPQALRILITGGKAAFKRFLATHFEIADLLFPYQQKFLHYLVEQKNLGRQLILCSASDELLLNPLNKNVSKQLGMSPQHPLFDNCWGSNGKINLAGIKKCERAVKEGIFQYDYAGDSWIDVAVWKKAENIIIVGSKTSFVQKIERVLQRPTQHFDPPNKDTNLSQIVTWAKALRLHQWVKNMLIFVPLLLAHNLEIQNWLLTFRAFLAFCFTASSVYVLNDLVDLEHDRAHPRKAKRPFASGAIPLVYGLAIIPFLLLISALIILDMPLRFQLVLCAYYALTLAYSFLFKQVALLDVLFLAGLYTIRIFAGSSVATIDVSDWLLTFSLFLFLSLAFVKRYAELFVMAQKRNMKISGRGYSIEDIHHIKVQGIASGYLAVLVLALYLSSATVLRMYSNPRLLWFIVPLFLYWISRVWLLASRGQMHDDPVVFALKDKTSYLIGFLIGACAVCAKLTFI